MKMVHITGVEETQHKTMISWLGMEGPCDRGITEASYSCTDARIQILAFSEQLPL